MRGDYYRPRLSIFDDVKDFLGISEDEKTLCQKSAWNSSMPLV